jgi:hypothetical protein
MYVGRGGGPRESGKQCHLLSGESCKAQIMAEKREWKNETIAGSQEGFSKARVPLAAFDTPVKEASGAQGHSRQNEPCQF